MLPQLCSRFSSLSPPRHVGARRDSESALPPSAAASPVQPTCRLSTGAGSSARGCAHRPLRWGAGHAQTVRPTQPPRAGRKSGGRRGWRAAEGGRGRAWLAAPRDHDHWLAPTPGQMSRVELICSLPSTRGASACPAAGARCCSDFYGPCAVYPGFSFCFVFVHSGRDRAWPHPPTGLRVRAF